MNRSGFASCSNPTTTSRSRFLRTMGQMGQLVHHGDEAGDGAALSQPCLPNLVPPLLDKPVLEAHLDWRSLSQAAEKDGRPSRSLSRIAVGPRDPSSCRSEGSCPKQPDFMSRSPRGVQTTQGSHVGDRGERGRDLRPCGHFNEWSMVERERFTTSRSPPSRPYWGTPSFVRECPC